MLPTTEMPDSEKTQRLNDAVKGITEITIKAIKNSISSIRTPQALVTESEFIEEFLTNCDRELYVRIRDHAIKLRSATELTPISIQCDNCQHEYKQEFTLDMTNFFATAS